LCGVCGVLLLQCRPNGSAIEETLEKVVKLLTLAALTNV
jgi:hypothetical protein